MFSPYGGDKLALHHFIGEFLIQSLLTLKLSPRVCAIAPKI
jgi:hypothetical protein